MHFTYKYIHHEVEKFQKYSDFLFFNVWLKAKGEFCPKKIRGFKELKNIYIRLHNDDTKGGDFFNRYIVDIYNEFRFLEKKDREKLKKWYKINNSIGKLCFNNQVAPVSYVKLIKGYPKLGLLLQTFYKSLYGKSSPFNLVAFNDLKELMGSHYIKFVSLNDEEICPYCGIKEIKNDNYTKREAYDHFIPKGKYPFNSINFKNLAPMCNECNSTYKLEREPLMYIDPLKKKERDIKRKAFYAFGPKKWEINLNVRLNSFDFENLSKEEIELEIYSIDKFSHKQQISGWREVYGIDERYKAKLLSKRGAKKWFNSINGELLNLKKLVKKDDISISKLYQMKIDEAESDPFDNCNFIKKAFLEECNKSGLFKSV